LIYPLYPHATDMANEAVIEQKMAEVSNIAVKLGVDRYLGTDRMNQVEAIVAEWAVQTEDSDILASESLWLDAKREIENILTDMSLTHNSKENLFLLGATQSGQIPLSDVSESLIEGWNKLLSIHANTITQMNRHDLETIDRARDSALSKIPVYGSVQEKEIAIESARQSLQSLEDTLVESSKRTEQAQLKGEIANRMTSKSMILAEAKSAKKQSLIPYGDYQEIESLLGNNGVFSEQMSSIGNFAHDPSIILEQMDRVLDRAMSILERESQATTTLAGGMFVTSERQQRISNLGSTNNTGDGMRISGNENKNYRMGYGGGNTASNTSIAPFDPRAPAMHKVSEESHTMNKHKAAGRLNAIHAKKNEGLYKTGLGNSFSNKYPSHTTVMVVGGFLALAWFGRGAFQNRKLRGSTPSGAITNW